MLAVCIKAYLVHFYAKTACHLLYFFRGLSYFCILKGLSVKRHIKGNYKIVTLLCYLIKYIQLTTRKSVKGVDIYICALKEIMLLKLFCKHKYIVIGIGKALIKNALIHALDRYKIL